MRLKPQGMAQIVSAMEKLTEERWIRMTLAAWLLLCVVLIVARWSAITGLELSDTDDNLRLMQVRDWLSGRQGWFDLRQYRLNPPAGLSIHWSRIVDLPIAGLILLTKPFLGTARAEMLAIAVAPLLPLCVVYMSVASLARRLVAPHAYLVALAFLVLSPFALGMFAPTRIDHHGWQLAALSLLAVALSGEPTRRSGVLAGFAIGLSLSIGLEMMPFLMIAAAALVLAWVLDTQQAQKLRWFAVALLATTSLGYFGFASETNRLPLCDALTPTWFSAAIDGSVAVFALSFLRARSLWIRLASATVAGGLVAVLFINTYPHCLGRLEGASPELQRLWLDRVTEAMPVTRQGWSTAITMASAPLFGLAGYAWMLWAKRDDIPALIRLLPFVLLAAVGAGLLLFQARFTPAAQILAVPGVSCLAWSILPSVRGSGSMLVRVFGTLAILIMPSGTPLSLITSRFSQSANVNGPAQPFAEKSCDDGASLRALNHVPAATMLTFIDIGPRLITTTHHSAVAGPYHRNGDAILDVFHAFGGTPDEARRLAKIHKATMILICPSLAEASQYLVRSPKGFYAQLSTGHVPLWLDAVPLEASSPFKLWRIKG